MRYVSDLYMHWNSNQVHITPHFDLQLYDPTVNYDSDSDSELNNARVSLLSLLILCRSLSQPHVHLSFWLFL